MPASPRSALQTAIVRDCDRWMTEHRVNGEPVRELMEKYVLKYNQGALTMHPSIRKKIRKISVASLYRWQKKTVPADTPSPSHALPVSGIHIRYQTRLTDEEQAFVLRLYLTPGQIKPYTIWQYLKNTDLYNGASHMAVKRFLDAFSDENHDVVIMAREGAKMYHDKIAGYIHRDWTTLEPDELWIADGHRIDVQVVTPDGRVKRPVVVVFQDARSAYITGLSLHYTETTDSVLQALSFGLVFSGTPRYILMDNGTSFKNFRMLGQQINGVKIDGILEKLGIAPIWSVPGNPQSKPIERTFLTLKNQFSRLYPSFTGGSPDTKPEALETLKNDQRPSIYELFRKIVGYIDYYNYQHNHARLKMATPAEVYHTIRHRCWEPADLAPMMRPMTARTVGRNGVKLTLAGREIWYRNAEYDRRLAGNRKKYLIYVNDYDLSSVDIHDLNGDYMYTSYPVQQVHPLAQMTDAGRKQISGQMAMNRRQRKLTRESLAEIQSTPIPDILELISPKKPDLLEPKFDHNFALDEDRLNREIPSQHAAGMDENKGGIFAIEEDTAERILGIQEK